MHRLADAVEGGELSYMALAGVGTRANRVQSAADAGRGGPGGA